MQFFSRRNCGPHNGLLFRLLAFVMLLTSISLLTVGCTDDHNDGPGKSLTSIIVTPQNASILEGMSMNLTALGVYSDGSTTDVTEDAEWSSDNDEIVSVSDGRITGIKAGAAVITASFGSNRSGTAAVTVLEAEPDQYIVVGASGIITDKITIIEGLKEQVRAFAVLDDGTAQDITESVKWSSASTAVATVSKGLIAAKKAGKSKITVSLPDNEKISEFTAEVVKDDVKSITLNKSKISVAAGYGDTLTALATFSSGKSADISASAAWKSSDAKIATVEATDFEAAVNGVAAGKAEVTASFGGKSASCKVTVTQAELVSMAFERNSVTVVKGLAEDLTVIGGFSDGSSSDITKNVTFTSDNTKVAVVESAGKKTTAGRVRGEGVGQANITAKAENGLTAQAAVEVIDAQVTALTISGNSSVIPGYTQQLTAKASYTDGTQKDVTKVASWSSSNTDSAMVTAGLVRALQTCEAPVVITASLNGVSAAKDMTVKNAKVTSLTIIGDTNTVIAGYEIQLNAWAGYSDGTSSDVTEIAEWSTGSDTTAVVDKGAVTGKAAGDVTITAKLEGVEATKSVKVSNAVVTALTVEAETDTVVAGCSLDLTAKATFSDGTDSVDVTDNVIWKSGDSTKAMITGGKLVGLAAGSVTVTAVSVNGVEATKDITVSEAQIVSLMILGDTNTVAAGYDIQLTALAGYSDGTSGYVTDDVTWSVSEQTAQYASVGADGTVTGIAKGTAVINAAIEGLEGEVEASKEIIVSDAVITELTIESDSDSVVPGRTIELVAKATFSDGTDDVDVTDSVIWKSSDNTKAMVSDGLVRGIAAGDVTVTAVSVNGVEATMDITVSEAQIVSLMILGDTNTVAAGYDIQLTALAGYSDGTSGYVTDEVEWSAEDYTDYALVSADGTVTGVAKGNAVITASIDGLDGTVEATKDITVSDAVITELTIEGDDTVVPGRAIELVAIATFSDGTYDVDVTDSVIWKSSDNTIAMVTNGLVRGISAGDITVTASVNDIEATTGITVSDALITNLFISGNDSVAAGYTTALTATAVYSDNRVEDVTSEVEWSADDYTDFVTVDEDGIVTGIAAGSATIVASIDGIDDTTIEASKDINVTDAEVTDLAIEGDIYTVAAGRTIDIAAIANFSDGTSDVDVTSDVIWKSSDNTIAMVTEGKVIGLAEGEVTVTATSVNGVEADITITVNAPEITSLVITGDSLVIAGNTVHMQAYASYSDGSSGYVTDDAEWSSEQMEYAEPVDGVPGDILGIAAGEATITATVQSGDTEITESFTLTVTDAEPVDLAITGDTLQVVLGETIDLTAIAELSDGTTDVDITNQVVWDSSEKDIAMVTAGKVIGLAEGQVTISASINGIIAEETVTVVNADSIVSISIDGYDGNPMVPTQTCQIVVNALKGSGDQIPITDNVTWDYDDAVLSIDGNGLMTALAVSAGQVTVTAQYTDPNTGDIFEDTITVEVIEDYVIGIMITGNIPEMVVNPASTLHTCPVVVEAMWYSGKDNTDIPSANLSWNDLPTGYISITPSGDNETTFEAIDAEPGGNDVEVTVIYHDTVSGEDIMDTVLVTVLAEEP